MNYLKIQFNNGNIKEYKTPFSNPGTDILCDLNSALFVDYKHLGKKFLECSNLEKFYTEYNKKNTLVFLGAKIIEFKKKDGRKKEIKALKYYSHRFLFENY